MYASVLDVDLELPELPRGTKRQCSVT
jgi:hypothetical protein